MWHGKLSFYFWNTVFIVACLLRSEYINMEAVLHCIDFKPILNHLKPIVWTLGIVECSCSVISSAKAFFYLPNAVLNYLCNASLVNLLLAYFYCNYYFYFTFPYFKFLFTDTLYFVSNAAIITYIISFKLLPCPFCNEIV